jgi:hypothetical protein
MLDYEDCVLEYINQFNNIYIIKLLFKKKINTKKRKCTLIRMLTSLMACFMASFTN